ncbi:MAG: hypothetical protein WC028_27120 [Candidatus Obscuribacterales bacterium]|jgi:hypothetical protein
MQKIFAMIALTLLAVFLIGRGGGESKKALVNNSDIVAFANLLRMDLPAANACSVGGKNVHYATINLASGSDIKGHMPKNLAIKYRYT